MRPVAGVPGVAAAPVRGAGRDRQQRRQVGRHPADHLHGDVPVGHVDVHLRAADVLLARPAAGTRAASARSARRPRWRRRSGRPAAPCRRRRRPARAARPPRPASPRSRCRCSRSSSSVAQTGVFVSTSERCSSGANSSPSSWAEQGVDLGGGPPRLQVDDVELLLHAQQGELAHGPDARTRLLRMRFAGATRRRIVTRAACTVGSGGAPAGVPRTIAAPRPRSAR